MQAIKIEVLGEAAPFRKKVANWQARDGRSGTHAYDERLYAGWKDHARLVASRAMDGRPPLDGQLDLHIRVFFAVPDSWSKRKKHEALHGIIRPTIAPDWDNLGKAVGDSLEMIVFRDDKQVVAGTVEKWYSDRPRVEMEIRELAVAELAELGFRR